METGLDAYGDQINAWMETICEKTFGDSESNDKKKRGQSNYCCMPGGMGGGAS